MSAPRPSEARGHVGPTIKILNCERHQHGPAARYRIDIALGGLRLSGLIVLMQAGEWWTALPTRPKLTNGKAIKRKGGGYVSEPIIEIPNEESKRRFDAAVITALNTYLSTQEAS